MTDREMLVNDVHAQLNATLVRRVLRPASVADVCVAVLAARAAGRAIAIAGGRHAMGGQQFGGGLDLLDMTGLDRVLDFDPERGEVEAEAGIMWPALIAWLHAIQDGQPYPWGIIQKQTGADRLTLGGALSSNVHGRVLGRGPIVDDVVAYPHRRQRHDAALLAGRECGALPARHRWVRAVRADRLGAPPAPRRKVRREVSLRAIDEVVATLEARADGGRGYGDFQFAIDPASADFLEEGICSCYVPVADDTPIPDEQRRSPVPTGRSCSTYRTSIPAVPRTPTPGTTWPPTGSSTGRICTRWRTTAMGITLRSMGDWARRRPARR